MIEIRKEVREAKVSPMIFSEYFRIINKELDLKVNPLQKNYAIQLNDAERILRIVCRLLSVTENSTILRCIGNMGHLTEAKVACESVAAHTNFAKAIMKEYLIFAYGWGKDPPNYSRDVIDLALQVHDLSENKTLDNPDNDEKKHLEKEAFERGYYRGYISIYSKEELGDDAEAVLRLLEGMNTRELPEERACYLSDKTSAFFHALMLNKMMSESEKRGEKPPYPNWPYALYDDPNITAINHLEMDMCDDRYKGGYLLSEVWTNDFLSERELNRYDDTGFFTAVTVMFTLFCHDCRWYYWRKGQYLP